MPTPDNWRRVEELYHAARARAAGQRAAFLADACAGDEALKREVESLLAQPASALGFLNEPAIGGDVQIHEERSTSELIGRQIGAYQVQALIGTGAMGRVYRARDTKLGREVAIKILPPAFTFDPERRARFDREARVLAALNHPNIATIYGVEDFDGVPALVLELVTGETLAERIARGPLSLSEILAIGRQIADGLQAAHERGILHRDLKPAKL
jgi:serine/threonine protein kinase